LPGPVITVSGPHGTGKTTYAKAIAQAFGLRYVCAGELFRRLAKERGMSLEDFSKLAAHDPAIDRTIDDRTKAEASEGGVVIDAQLAAWMVGDLADVKVLCTAPDEVRVRRIAERDRSSFQDAQSETLARELIQRDRYKKYYGIDIDDLSVYDLKIDTSQNSVDEIKRILIDAVREFLESKGKQS